MPEPRVVFVGMPGAFSTAPLAALLANGFDVRAILVPAARGRHAARAVAWLEAPLLPVLQPNPTIVQLGWHHQIPVVEVANLGAPDAMALLQSFAPNAMCVACWAWRVPAAVLALPPLGVLNVHPSLLPQYRGPEPIFWTLRDGVHQTGVTVHRMDQDFDTGPILAQAPVALPDGASDREIAHLCAEQGGAALVDALHGLAAGTLVPREQPAGGSYAPLPDHADFTLDRAWTARHAFNFMRGAAAWGEPFTLDLADERLVLRAARSYDPVASLGAPYRRDGDDVLVQFASGVVRAR